MFAMQRIRGQLRASHRSRAPRPAAAGAAAIAGALPLVLLAACGAPICPMFPADNVWNTDISKLPVHPRSAAWLKSMDSARTFLHPDFGPNPGGFPFGLPFNVVTNAHPLVRIKFADPAESDKG